MNKLIFMSLLKPGLISNQDMKKSLNVIFSKNKFFTPKKYGEMFADLKLNSEISDVYINTMQDFYTKNKELLVQSGQNYVYFLPSKDKNSLYGTLTISSNKKKNPIVTCLSEINDIVHLIEPPFSFSSTEEAFNKSFNREVQKDGYSEIEVTVKDYSCGLTNAYWRMWFGPQYVNFIGIDKLNNAPVYKSEYNNDIYFVQLFEDPDDWNKPEGKKAISDFKAAVGIDMFYDPANPHKKLNAPDFSNLITK